MIKLFSGYDLIGDIHGHARALKRLLTEMGYRKKNGAWRHPERCAIFVGDLIDRGPRQREVIEIVRAMVEEECAQICAGNHELNAVGYATEASAPAQEKSVTSSTTYFRPHSAKNYAQHEAFLSAYPPHSRDYQEVIQWFCQLPLWLHLETTSGEKARVIHACWDPKAQADLTPYLQRNDQGRWVLGESFNPQVFERSTRAFTAIERLLKGPELKLPDGVYFYDKSGIRRSWARVQWWREARTWREAILLSGGDLKNFDLDTPLTEPLRLIDDSDTTPVFFGHYWRGGRLELLSDRFACLDWSVAKEGRLVAYRWSGEQTLTSDHFHAVWA